MDLPFKAPLQKAGIVVQRGAPGQWDAGMVESPMVWFDARRARYGMAYTGYAWADPPRMGYTAVTTPQIGLAWSRDLVHWTKDLRNPVFGPSNRPGQPDEAGSAGPFLWVEDGRYYLFYFGLTEAGYERGHKTLNLATAPDGYTWTRHPQNPIIQPGGTGWYSEAIWHPNVQKVDGRYYLFFNASGVVDGHAEEYTGYATALDLHRWQVAPEPVLVGSRTPGRWDARGRVGDPSLFRVEDVWYMAYYSWDGVHAQDGYAWTPAASFPVDWTPFDANPVLKTGPADSFDALHAAKPFIVRTLHQHYHFYTAVDERESREIALAYAAIW